MHKFLRARDKLDKTIKIVSYYCDQPQSGAHWSLAKKRSCKYVWEYEERRHGEAD